jgi:hypothetical protein
MPFLLYRENENNSYERQSELQIAGKYGPIATHASNLKEPWHMDEAQILTMAGIEKPCEHAIIIDLKPRDTKYVSLYQLKNIWGYPYEEFTPVLLHLKTLYTDKHENRPEEFKKSFSIPTDRENVFEFLYLRGGIGKGTWNWGMVGRVNGVLLWKDAISFFMEAIEQILNKSSCG